MMPKSMIEVMSAKTLPASAARLERLGASNRAEAVAKGLMGGVIEL